VDFEDGEGENMTLGVKDSAATGRPVQMQREVLLMLAALDRG